MIGYVTVIHTVSMVPITTIGTSVSYVELPTNCVVVDSGVSCLGGTATSSTPTGLMSSLRTVAPPNVAGSSTRSATATVTLATSSTSSTIPATASSMDESTKSATSLGLSSQSSSRIHASPSMLSTTSLTRPINTSTAVHALQSHSNQTGLALGIAFSILSLFIVAGLLFAWKTNSFPFRRKAQPTEETGVSLKMIPHGKEERWNDLPAVPIAGLFREGSSTTKEDSISSLIQQRTRPVVALDFLGNGKDTERPREDPPLLPQPLYQSPARPNIMRSPAPSPLPPRPLKPKQSNSFTQTFEHRYRKHPSTPPPSSPLPPIPGSLDNILDSPSQTPRSHWYWQGQERKKDAAAAAGELGASQSRDEGKSSSMYGVVGENAASHWSLEREVGSRSSLEGDEQEDDVWRDEFHRVTGFEHLGLREEEKRK
ncbi:hypothetical protein SMMN14_04041 [Sphaerulina musiva]